MNSALQCISHTQDLTKYFLAEHYLNELNKNNKYGSGGDIAKAYYSLISELWKGNSSSLSPWDFRQIFIRFVKQFVGFTQHDSHEMLAFMLDTLHEDLNRIKNKPYQELNEKSKDESDDQASLRWWESHLKRENSIIVDLFHGQYKSIIECPVCKRVSITFDPFMFLSLPIPEVSKSMSFPIISYDGEITLFSLKITEETTINEVRDKIADKFNISSLELISLILFSNSKVVGRIGLEKTKVMILYEKSYELAFFQNSKPILDKEYFLNNITFVMPTDASESLHTLAYPQPYLIKNETFGEYRMNIMKIFRKYLKKVDGKCRKGSDLMEFKNKENDEEFLSTETRFYLDKPSDPEYSNEDDDLAGKTAVQRKAKLMIFNNLPDKVIEDVICDYCGNKNCSKCEANFDLETKMQDIVEKASRKNRVLIFLFEISNELKSDTLDRYEKMLNLNCEVNRKNTYEEVNLYDCFEAFRTTERLGKENSWYCNICKEHQQAFKTMRIYKAPLYLIIQLKRFKMNEYQNTIFGGGMDKNEEKVDFPINGLNLTEYVDKKHNDETFIYDLYAVSQHYGSLRGGHYTAVAKEGDSWSKFDDSHVYGTSEKGIVDNSAYLLFYKRRINLSN